jgi:hypothetical protein
MRTKVFQSKRKKIISAQKNLNLSLPNSREKIIKERPPFSHQRETKPFIQTKKYTANYELPK